MSPLLNAEVQLTETLHDVIVIGAGPTGLACAIDAQDAGLDTLIVEKGCICNSLFHYPVNMVFFTTPELLEIGNIPFPSPNQKPTRNEALEYYRQVAAFYELDIRQYHRVTALAGHDGDFLLQTHDRFGRRGMLRTRKIIVATGYYDLPNYLQIPGEELSKVRHYYDDPHPYFDMDVVVIGAKNSAAIAALELWRHGARVTMVVREEAIHRHVKYWIKPDIENRIKNGEIRALFNSNVTEVLQDAVVIAAPEGRIKIKNDFVFAMTGYHPDFEFLDTLGVKTEGPDKRPVCNAETLESNVKGIYLAGVIVAGVRTNEIFIENGRFHGEMIAKALAEALDIKESE